MRVELTVSVRLLFCAALAFIFLSWPVRIVAQEKPDPLIQPSPVPSPQQTPQQPNNVSNESVLVNTDLISFNVTVTDSFGRFVSGLSKTAFSVFDDKEAEDITFFSDDDAPIVRRARMYILLCGSEIYGGKVDKGTCRRFFNSMRFLDTTPTALSKSQR